MIIGSCQVFVPQSVSIAIGIRFRDDRNVGIVAVSKYGEKIKPVTIPGPPVGVGLTDGWVEIAVSIAIAKSFQIIGMSRGQGEGIITGSIGQGKFAYLATILIECPDDHRTGHSTGVGNLTGDSGIGFRRGKIHSLHFGRGNHTLPDSKVIHPSLEIGGIALWTVAEGEHIIGIGYPIAPSPHFGGIGNELSVMIDSKIGISKVSAP